MKQQLYFVEATDSYGDTVVGFVAVDVLSDIPDVINGCTDGIFDGVQESDITKIKYKGVVYS